MKFVAMFTLVLHFAAAPCLGGEEYDPSKATGTITGEAVFLGETPNAKTLEISRPDGVRIREGLPPLKSEELVVSSNRRVANVVVYVSKGFEKYSFKTMKPELAWIETKECRFNPHLLAIQTAQPVELRNADPTMVNFHGMPQANNEWNLALTSGETKATKLRLDTPEMGIRMMDHIHLWMTSVICVFDHPFFAVTKADGTFEIKLPPGDYEISFWHESRDKVTVPPPLKVTVTAGKPTEIKLEVKDVNYNPKKLTEEEEK